MSIIGNNLSIGYADKVVQQHLSFVIEAGELVCLLGPNGCGKSTLLHTLAGLLPPKGGEYRLGDMRPEEIAAGKGCAVVLTERISMESTSVHDVVAMGRYPYTSFLGGLRAEDEQIVAEALKAVGLEAIADTRFNAHSDGEKQRIMIAKALAQQTPVLLLDEPTAHLDVPNRIQLFRLLRQLAREEQKAVIISTHELDMALEMADRILLMMPNEGIQLDRPDRLRETIMQWARG